VSDYRCTGQQKQNGFIQKEKPQKGNVNNGQLIFSAEIQASNYQTSFNTYIELIQRKTIITKFGFSF
jgi:translation initiation factor 2 beta subunit (eIF-2beta)/eIF-5